MSAAEAPGFAPRAGEAVRTLWASTAVGRAQRGVDRLVTIALVMALSVLSALVLAWLSGHRVMIDRSDSMAPAIRAGDLVLTQEAPAGRIEPGQVVTFPDPVRDRSVTHRVVASEPAPGGWSFVTRGDANAHAERWSVAASEPVARVAATVPLAGFYLAPLTSPVARLLTITLCGLALCGLALRAIWRP